MLVKIFKYLHIVTLIISCMPYEAPTISFSAWHGERFENLGHESLWKFSMGSSQNLQIQFSSTPEWVWNVSLLHRWQWKRSMRSYSRALLGVGRIGKVPSNEIELLEKYAGIWRIGSGLEVGGGNFIPLIEEGKERLENMDWCCLFRDTTRGSVLVSWWTMELLQW